MVLEFYYDLLSQPCRAVYIFLKATNVDFEAKVMSLIAGDHYKEDFIKLNPMHKIPMINDDGFVLTESVAILRYAAGKHDVPNTLVSVPRHTETGLISILNKLQAVTPFCNYTDVDVAILRYAAQKHDVAENWYPRQDAQRQGRVDEFLNWHHMGLRKSCVELFLTLFRSRIGVGRFTKIEYDEEKIKALREAVVKAVKEIDECFLKGRQFVAGDEISVADLIAYCELKHLKGVGEAGVFTANQGVDTWMKAVEAKLGSTLMDEAFVMLNGIQEKYESAK